MAAAQSPGGRHALGDVRVLDLTTDLAGPMAAMLLADFGAEVVKVEPPGGDPARSRPGFAMWNRAKQSVIVDCATEAGRARLGQLVGGADLIVAGPLDAQAAGVAGAAQALASNPAVVYLSMPRVLDETPWAGGAESAGLLWAHTGLSLRQSSFEGGPIDPVFPYMLYMHAVWGAAAAMAALVERERSGLGQVVTVGGVHAAMVAASASLLIDPKVPEIKANYGPGGPHPMYTRYRCGDGEWLFLATLTTKFQHRAIEVLGLGDVLEDERIGGRVEAMLLPDNRARVRQRFSEVFASKPRDEWLATLREADVPAGPVFSREGWLDSERIAAVNMRAEIEDPERGRVVMPASSINLASTPACVGAPAPRPGEHPEAGATWAPRPRPGSEDPRGRGPLDGVRVLDLGTILAGPYAGTLLAELGADVIKVETPTGDSWRERGMVYIRGQRGVAIDLRAPEGLEAFYALVRSADVVLDNYRAGVVGRLTIDHASLCEVRPDVITVSITGFGDSGPFSSEPAFDPLLQARSGMMAAQGGDSEPVLLTVAVNDVVTAASAVLGTLLALFHRNATGEGQHVWLSLAGTAALAQCEEILQMEGRPEPQVGGRDFIGPSALERSYATADEGWIRVAIPPSSLPGLLDAGLLEALPDGDGELSAALEASIGGLARASALERLTSAGVPAAAVRRLRELTEDPAYERAGVFNTLERQDGPTLAPGRYARFSRTERRDTLAPPGVGEHTAEVLAEVGYDREAVEDLAARGIVTLGSPMVLRAMVAYR